MIADRPGSISSVEGKSVGCSKKSCAIPIRLWHCQHNGQIQDNHENGV